MSEMRIRPAERGDLPRITEIYNYYVLNTPVTFDVEAYTAEQREAWFAQVRRGWTISSVGGRGESSGDGIRRDSAVPPEGSV